MKTFALFLLLASLQCCFGQTDTNLIATGEWSETVSDGPDYALRGRLLVYDDRSPSAANHARVYLELQHVFPGGWANPVEVYFEFGIRTDLHFEMRDKLDQPIRLEPFSKFPVVRDLAVDRSVLFENLKAVKAWVPIDGTYDLGSGPRMTAEEQEAAYPLSRCISCCCCMEACPQFDEDTGFVGAATISQVRLFNTHPTGAALKRERLAALMGDGGIQECGFAQNCVEVCPKDIPLTRSISEVGGEVMKQAIGDLFRK